MRFGVREICNVVFRAKANQKVGNKIFYRHEPVIYFDTLKTSSLEGAATTVYAQGGRGNSRLVAWEGERTVTFTMEDALISPVGFSILSGAGVIEAEAGTKAIKVHTTEKIELNGVDGSVSGSGVTINLANEPYTGDGDDPDMGYIYVMLMEKDEVVTEPYIPASVEGKTVTLKTSDDVDKFYQGCVVLVDYYVAKESGAYQIDITPDKFGGNYYVEADTLFRDTDGVDRPAEFIIPNCKIQSNFTFTMASSGDPSTFTFTLDAFPDYTRFNKTKKVLAALQIIAPTEDEDELLRPRTKSNDLEDPVSGQIIDPVTGTTKREESSEIGG